MRRKRQEGTATLAMNFGRHRPAFDTLLPLKRSPRKINERNDENVKRHKGGNLLKFAICLKAFYCATEKDFLPLSIPFL